MTWSLTLVLFTCSLSEVSNLNSELNMIKDKDGEGKLMLTARDRIEHYTYSTVHLQYSTLTVQYTYSTAQYTYSTVHFQYSTVQYSTLHIRAKLNTAQQLQVILVFR